MTEAPSTVLLVEDDDATRIFLADNLTADGYELLVAETIREGARLLESGAPDVAVVDVGLPDGSGLDLVRHVREADGLASHIDPFTPMLVLSGRAGDVDRIRGFERGADDYVPKASALVVCRGRRENRSRPFSSTRKARPSASMTDSSASRRGSGNST